MWLLLAFLSAALLGFYDVFKKQSLKNNAVIPVLTLNTLFSSLIFLPFIVLSAWRPDTLEGGLFFVPVPQKRPPAMLTNTFGRVWNIRCDRASCRWSPSAHQPPA